MESHDIHLLQRAIGYLKNSILPGLKDTKKLGPESSERKFFINLIGLLLRITKATRKEVEDLLIQKQRTFLSTRELQEIIEDEKKRDVFLKGPLSEALQTRFSDLTFAGKGGMGFVLKAFDRSLEREVALKFTYRIQDQVDRDQFLREGRRAAQLGVDRHVVAVFDTGTAELVLSEGVVDFPFLVLEYIPNAKDGRWLLDEMTATKKILDGQKRKEVPRLFPTSAILIMAHALTQGLNMAHRLSIIHRDIKPENMLFPHELQVLLQGRLESVATEDLDLHEGLFITALLKTKSPKLADFGLAGIRERTIQKKSEASPEKKDGDTISDTGALIGTPYFIPPEAYLDDPQGVEKPGDVYALGLLLYMLFTGHDNPLEFSRGVKKSDAKATGWSYYMSRVGNPEDQSSLIAGPEKDPFLKDFLKKPTDHHEDIALFLQVMTAKNPKDRPPLEKVLLFLEKEIKTRSPEARKARREQKMKLLAFRIGGVALFALLATLMAYPFVIRHRQLEHIREEHGHTLKGISDHFSKQHWLEAITLIEAASHHVEESDLPAKEKNAFLEELNRHHEEAKRHIDSSLAK